MPPPALKPQGFFAHLRQAEDVAGRRRQGGRVGRVHRAHAKLPFEGLYSEQQRATELSFPPTATVQRKPRAAAPRKKARPVNAAPARFCDRCWRRMDASGTLQDVQPVRLGVALLVLVHRARRGRAGARTDRRHPRHRSVPARSPTRAGRFLPATGGFARLRREGTRATIAYEHAVTDTAPGHATLMTGAPPRESGIYANEILDPATRKKVSVLRDPSTRVLAADGKPRDLPSSSLAALRLPTIADGERAAHPDATIVSLSLKDRSALPGGGRAPTAVVWFDAGLGGFVTSTAFARAFPAWALAHGGPGQRCARVRARRGRSLDARVRVGARRHARRATGRRRSRRHRHPFPHALAQSTNAPHAFRSTPFADEVLLALAVDAIDAAPAGRADAAGAVALGQRLRRPRLRPRFVGGVGRARAPRRRPRPLLCRARRALRRRAAGRSCSPPITASRACPRSRTPAGA